MRQNFNTSVAWESIVGYSRAVRIGNVIEVSGTVSILDGKAYGGNDPYLQTKRILEIIGYALAHFGASYTDVIRTRIYVTDITNSWEAVGRAHGEVFRDIRPATSMVEVKALITPEYLVEIEATAVLE
jgi:enamine deaminase RidA (YjgF/YER057c/UK114 family)